MISNGVAMTSTNTGKRSLWRLTSAIVLGAMLPVSLMPAGCIETTDYVEVQSPQQQPESATVVEQALPEATRSALQICANAHAATLQKHSYDIAFEIQVTARGEIEEIKTKGNPLENAEVETCMTAALKALSVRNYLRPDDSLTSPPEPQSVLSSSRALLGTTALLPQAIRLAPIVITAPGGITIVVAVAIVVVAVVALGKLSKECQKQWDDARKICAQWIASPDGKRGLTGGYTNVEDCARGRVDERCKGNEVDWGKQGRPGRRY